MWEAVKKAGSWAVDLLLPHLRPHLEKAVNTVKEVPKDAADMKAKFDEIQGNIHDADRRAEAEEGKTRDAIKAKVKQLMETSFRMEDIIDGFGDGDDPGCTALPCKIVDLVKTMPSRLHFSYMNEGAKSEFGGIKDRKIKIEEDDETKEITKIQQVMLHNLRYKTPVFIMEDEVVGFEGSRAEWIDLLVNGSSRLTVISVVGMGGQGKTTLAKKVFDNEVVRNHFICHAWITVSQFGTAEKLLEYMLKTLCEEIQENPPENVTGELLILEVRSRLQRNRYVVVFDDVWNASFWCELESAFTDNNDGSRILITTRNKSVAMSCRRSTSLSPIVEVLQLQPLTPDKSLELFYRKAFGSNLDPRCPDNLRGMSTEIVNKCEGLPLAIVAIGGVLACNDGDILEWQRFSQNLSLELGKNPFLFPLTKILAISYHDLPYYLKPCFLYFGIYPEDYQVEYSRLIRQWVAEGFVKHEQGRTLEEVAAQNLTELINRSLVQVSSSFTSDGELKICRVRYLLRHMILKKIEDLCFCHFTREHENWPQGGTIRRLTITSSSNNWMTSVESSNISLMNIRSLHVFSDEELEASFVRSIPEKYKLLKVLDFEGAPLYDYVPEDLGNLVLLRYLSFKDTRVTELSRSILMLHNLETLDLRNTLVSDIPREINKLKKLRHLLV